VRTCIPSIDDATFWRDCFLVPAQPLGIYFARLKLLEKKTIMEAREWEDEKAGLELALRVIACCQISVWIGHWMHTKKAADAELTGVALEQLSWQIA